LEFLSILVFVLGLTTFTNSKMAYSGRSFDPNTFEASSDTVPARVDEVALTQPASAVTSRNPSEEKLYNNPLTDDYTEPSTIPYGINLQNLRRAPAIKIIDKRSLGTEFNPWYWFRNLFDNDVREATKKFFQALEISSFRTHWFDRFDPLSREVNRRLQLAVQLYWLRLDEKFGGLSKEQVKKRKETIDTYEKNNWWDINYVPLLDLIDLSLTDSLQLEGTSRIILGLNAAFAFDPDEEYVDPSGQKKKGVGHYIYENPQKYVPLIAQRNAEVVRKIKEQYGSKAFDSLVFEIGNEVWGSKYGGLTPATYAEVVRQSVQEMKKVEGSVKIIIYFGGDDQGGITLIDGRKYDVGDLLKGLKDIKQDIAGLVLHLYTGSTSWKEYLSFYRKLAEKEGFGGVPFWITEYNFAPLNILKQQEFSNASYYLKTSLELITREDIETIDLYTIPGTGFGELYLKSAWLTKDCRLGWDKCYTLVDPYLYTNNRPVWRMVSAGYAYKIFKQVFSLEGGNKLQIRSLRSSKRLFEFFGQTSQGDIRGVLINLDKIAHTYTIRNAQGTPLKAVEMKEAGERPQFFKVTSYPTELRKIKEQLQEIQRNLGTIQMDPKIGTAIKNDLNDFFSSRSDKKMRQSLGLALARIYSFLGSYEEIKKPITTLQEILKTMFSERGVQNNYIADLRVDQFPEVRAYSLYPDQKGRLILQLPVNSIVFVGEGDFRVDIEDALLDSLPVIRQAIKDKRLPQKNR